MDIKHAPELEKSDYKLKTIDEDFVVEELFKYDLLKNGKFYVFKMVKANLNTIDAIRIIGQRLKIDSRDIGCAGLKDRKAVTIQFISIPSGISIEDDNDFSNDDTLLQLIKVGYRKERIFPGCLSGNKFTVTVRNLTDSVVAKYKEGDLSKNYINFFGEQRFSINNHVIGKHMIKKEYKEALDLIAESLNGRDKEKLIDAIENCGKNYLQAFLSVDKKILRLYLHAYQSLLWNKSALKYLEIKSIDSLDKLSSLTEVYMPMVGFDIEGEDDVVAVVEEIMSDEELSPMDFVLRQFQNLGLEGGNRSLANTAEECSIVDIDNDEFNSGMNKITLNFSLAKGSYATEYVRQLLM